MQDRPPQNRAERRAQAHKRGPKSPRVPALLRPRSQNAPRDQTISTGAPSGKSSAESDSGVAEAETLAGGTGDTPPADRRRAVSHHKGAGKLQRIHDGLLAYYGLAGFAVSRVDQTDGEIIAGSGEACAQAWMDAGKADPKIMRMLEIITISGPYLPLVLVHAQVANAILTRHNASPLALFARVDVPHAPQQPQAKPEPAPLPYQPAGPNAPTAAPAGPPPYADMEQLRVYPDELITSEMDVALRQMARESGMPYGELRDQLHQQLAQELMQKNGRVQAPGALGAQVARE